MSGFGNAFGSIILFFLTILSYSPLKGELVRQRLKAIERDRPKKRRGRPPKITPEMVINAETKA